VSPHPISQPVGGCHTLHAPPGYQGSLLTAADCRTIEVRGQLTDREHLDALRLVQRRLGTSWIVPAVFLGGPASIVVRNLMAGESLARAHFLRFTGRTMAQIVTRGAITAAGRLEAVRGLLRERLGERGHLVPACELRGTPVRDGGT
jgi:hypothetical protein